MTNLVCAPVLVPLATALAVLPLGARRRLQGGLSLAGAAVSLLASAALLARVWGGALLVLNLGSWGAGVGVVWVVDGLSALMLVAVGCVLAATVVCLPGAGMDRPMLAKVQALVHLLAAGVNGALLTADLFNLFVFYEVMLLASFALVVAADGQSMGKTYPYVVVNLVSSMLFLAAVGVLYAMAGTVNLAELSLRLSRGETRAPVWVALGLVLSVFGVKAGLVPVFMWLPDSYPAAPLPITALFAGTLTKVGVYSLFRILPLISPADRPLDALLVWAGAATMAVGVVGALGRSTIRGILSFHVVSQVGYMVFGLGLGTPAALAAALLFAVHNMAVKPALLLAGGVAERLGGTGELKALGGLVRSKWAALAFFLPAMALAGLPPLSGFWGKLLLVHAGFAAGRWTPTAVAVAVSLLTLASMLKIWSAAYWGEPPADVGAMSGDERRLVGAALGLGTLAVALGLSIGPLYRFAESAARQVLAVSPYLEAVLGRST